MELEKIIERLGELEKKAAEYLDTAEKSDSAEDVKALTAKVTDEIQPEIERLKDERQKRELEESQKALSTQVTSLEKVIEDLRKPTAADFKGAGSTDEDDETPYAEGGFFADIKAANKGRQDALERLTAGLGIEGKAMTEGTGAQGGYLVQKLIERQIVQTRELDNVLRGLCSKLSVSTNEIELNQISLGTTAGWVAELAAKPESTALTLATVTASVFTAAGLATISNQLLADSNPAVDRLVTADLAKRLVALEEAAFLAGTGTGQPLGILNTPGVTTTTVGTASPAAIIDGILAAIGKVEEDVPNPNLTILLHPRTWTYLLTAKDVDEKYLLDPNATISDPRTVGRGPQKRLWGYNVVTSNRIPTNLGAGTNESRAIVGDFSEALILDRQGITVDESPHVYFTTNQTVFRAEQRVGFTAARQPKAFNIVGGAGFATH